MQQDNSQNTYLPLFRKYRPQSFKDVIGQEFTVQALTNAIKLNKIANAYLFCGPRGTGKTSSARIFAKSLNCAEGPTVDPCQKCQSCLDVTNASGLDVIEIDAATNRGIDDAKELISKVQYAPMNGKYKIFIIDEVHMLSKEAFNALLKTFEEPPKNVIFILATTEPHKVIETIVSRCQRFDFRRITIDDIVKRLREISDIEKINIEDEALYAIAKNVSGGMRDSLALLDQASILGIDTKITKETIESLIGKLTFEILYGLTENILNKDAKKAVLDVENIYKKGCEPRNFVENYMEFLRNTILASDSKNVDETEALTLLGRENISKIQENKLFNKTNLVPLLDKVIEFYKEIKNSTNPYLWAELMVISACKNETATAVSKTETVAPTLKQAPIEAQPKKPEIIQENTPKISEAAPPSKSEPAPVEIKAEKPAATEDIISKSAPIQSEPQNVQAETPAPASPAQSVSSSTDPSKIWSEILNKVESIPAKFFYSGVGKLVNISNGQITLGFVNQNAIAQAKSDNKYNPLIKAIKSVLGEGGNIEFITITKDTKVIDAKINVTIAQGSQKPSYQRPEQKAESQNNSFEPKTEVKPSTKEVQEEDNSTVDTSNYTKVTREMIEAYSGKLVE